MDNYKELTNKELIEINGGSRLPFPILNYTRLFWNVAKAGWRFGKYLAE